MKKDTAKNTEITKFILASVAIGIMCAILADALKTLTENYEHKFLSLAEEFKFLFLVFPLIGLVLIALLRVYLFKRRENKGIKEIYDTLKTRHNELPLYKVPSHFINGLLTLSFGGSTGIEVATVVACASIGSASQSKAQIHHIYRKELICAGVAAGVTALFNSPIAGALFALEVILRKTNRHAFLGILIAVMTVWGFNFLLHTEVMFHPKVDHWNYYALPYFIFLGVLAGLNSVYLTRSVIFLKARFRRIKRSLVRISIGAGIIGIIILFFPTLYGDGYHMVKDLFTHPEHIITSGTFMLLLASLIVLKPIATSITLAAGGDGGIFGPSLLIGAFLGALLATVLNTFFHVNVIPVNFMIAGMGAVLSASLHAPFTAIFVVCGMTDNYALLVPLLISCLTAKITARMILPYTVYSYEAPVNKLKQPERVNS